MTSPQGARSAQERNAAAVDQLETEAAVSVRAAIAAMLAEVLDAVGDLDDDTVAPTVETIAAAARRVWSRLVARVVDWVRDTFTRLVTRAVANLPDDSAPDLPPRTVDQRVQSLMSQIRDGLDGVPDVVASRTVTALREGYQQGESPAQLRRRVADVLARDEWDDEVTRIARTTTTSVYNAAHSAVADALEVELGRPLRRMWLATRDSRTRPTHVEANGQIVPSGEPFRVGDARLRFPGDPLGPPEEVILCRCVVVPVVNDMVVDLAHRVAGREAAVLDDTDDQPMAAGADELVAATRMPPQFVTYWTVGEGGARIRWNTEGDFRRCQRALRRYLDVGEVDGACANLHKLATGKWPAEKSTAAAEEEEAGMPCPCENETAAETVTAADLEEARTMAMIALVPSEADAAGLAVEGEAAIPAEELHVTLAFLGPGEEWAGTDNGARLLELAERVAADAGPITARIWARAATGGDTETGATPFYVLGDDTGRLAELQGGLLVAAGGVIPAQHSPYVAHLSTRYGNDDLTGMDAVGSDVTLDRIRVAFGADVVDFPLSGDDTLDLDDEPEAPAEDEEEPAAAAAAADPDDRDMVEDRADECECDPATNPDADPDAECPCAEDRDRDRDEEPMAAAADTTPAAPLVRLANLAAASDAAAVVAEAAANAPAAPPGAWFVPVKVDGPTPPTVTAAGRVWGHIGQADVCHVGIKDECVTIPPTRTGYGAFHRDQVVTAEGDTVAVGYLYTGCEHSDLNLTLDQARDHLDAACTRTAVGRVYDTEFGPMFVGAVVPGASAANVAALHRLSGEWFVAPLELHAAVGVEAAGFPVDGTGEEIRVSDVDPEPAEQIAAAARVDEPRDDRPDDRDLVAASDVVAAHIKRAAMRTAEPAVVAARRNRAARTVAGYEKRGA